MNCWNLLQTLNLMTFQKYLHGREISFVLAIKLNIVSLMYAFDLLSSDYLYLLTNNCKILDF